jgi:predicted alpha/beta superfamily hydrolase
MTAENIIVTVRNELIRSIAALDEWFDSEESLMEFQPSTGRCVRFRHMVTNKLLPSLMKKYRTLRGCSDQVALAGYCLRF